MSYTFRRWTVPQDMMDALRRYIDHGIPPGDFLQAVLRNDLADAVGRADDDNMEILPAYVAYLWNECPSDCWGSLDKVKAWIESHRKVGV